MEARDYVVGVFRDGESAVAAVEALREAGLRPEDVSLLIPEPGERPMTGETKAAEGAATGAATGGLLGGVGGWLAAAGILTLPVAGPVVVAGALGAALAGAAAGLGLGAVAGGLIGLGIPEPEATWYEEQVRGGASLVAVRAPDAAARDAAHTFLRRAGAYEIEDRAREGIG